MFSTSQGSRLESFGWVEWSLLVGIATIWGSSFLLIEIGLESLAPTTIAWLRITLGFVVLLFVPAARQPIQRNDYSRVTVIGVLWMAIPLMLFPFAQQHIDSALAGMLNASVPLFGALVAAIVLRSRPRVQQGLGITLGFIGAVTLSLPEVVDSRVGTLGVLLVLLATLCYGIAMNLAVPLQQRYGAPPIIMRALGIACVLTMPLGAAGLVSSKWELGPVLAVIVLGVINTGAAFAIMTVLVGRAGATRAGTAVYCIPLVAIVLGVALNSEVVVPLQWVGILVVLLGAWLTSRSETAIAARAA